MGFKLGSLGKLASNPMVKYGLMAVNPVMGVQALAGLKAAGGNLPSWDGQSGTDQVSTLTADQRALMDKYISSIYGGAGKTVETLQGFADKGFNPYDSVSGDKLVGDMRGYISDDAQKQIDAIKGSSLNRFSLASNKAMSDIDTAKRKQITDLDYNNLMNKANFAQTAYGNQNDAISKLFSMGGAMVGQGAFQNNETYKPGLYDRIGQGLNIAGGVTGIAKTLFGGA